MTSAPPTRAFANLHLHLEYDSGLDVIAAAMATVPEGDDDMDEHRAHVSNDVSSAVAHLLDIDALTPEGCPIRVTNVAMEVSVDLDEPLDLESGADESDLGELFDHLEPEGASDPFAGLGLSEQEYDALIDGLQVRVSLGPPPADLVPDTPAEAARFVADWGLACGYLVRSCSYAVDMLFEDLEQVTAAWLPGGESRRGGTQLEEFLPEQWSDKYTPHFVRRLIVTLSNVTARIASEWLGPLSVAEALATSYLFEFVEVLAELDDVALRDDMLDELRARLVDDEILDDLYELEGRDDLFDSWFTPFVSGAPIPPYAADPVA